VRVAWDKPLVVLCNENTYSNAEIFCHAIQQAKRAPLVGTETAGGVISAVSTRITGIGKLQVPFRGWFHAETGVNLDHRGAVPDHPVPVSPADEARGADLQLAKALEVMEGLLKPR
jgi:tricorn protease